MEESLVDIGSSNIKLFEDLMVGEGFEYNGGIYTKKEGGMSESYYGGQDVVVIEGTLVKSLAFGRGWDGKNY